MSFSVHGIAWSIWPTSNWTDCIQSNLEEKVNTVWRINLENVSNESSISVLISIRSLIVAMNICFVRILFRWKMLGCAMRIKQEKITSQMASIIKVNVYIAFGFTLSDSLSLPLTRLLACSLARWFALFQECTEYSVKCKMLLCISIYPNEWKAWWMRLLQKFKWQTNKTNEWISNKHVCLENFKNHFKISMQTRSKWHRTNYGAVVQNQ